MWTFLETRQFTGRAVYNSNSFRNNRTLQSLNNIIFLMNLGMTQSADSSFILIWYLGVTSLKYRYLLLEVRVPLWYLYDAYLIAYWIEATLLIAKKREVREHASVSYRSSDTKSMFSTTPDDDNMVIETCVAAFKTLVCSSIINSLIHQRWQVVLLIILIFM